MDLLLESLGFAAKGLVVFVTLACSVAVIAYFIRRGRRGDGSHLEVVHLNERYASLSNALRAGVLDKGEFKAHLKEEKKAHDALPKGRPRVFVLEFDGDVFAGGVEDLREEVSAVLGLAAPEDEVVLRLESPGGGVPHYGLAAAQLVRLKEKKVKVTVCVDRVAASGGYMIACVADTIVAAPFAVIGSIGVVAQVPNVHRLLTKHDVDFLELTAGEFKRTVTVFGEVTEKGRQKLQGQLEETHGLFKAFVKQQRPKLDVDAVATGEYWLGTRSLALGLVDRLGTSDDYLLERTASAEVYQVTFRRGASWRERLALAAVNATDRALVRLWTRARALELS